MRYATAIENAFGKLEEAQDAVLILALQLDRGATSAQIGPRADVQIRDAIRRLHEARYEADQALCTAMRGEPYRPSPTQSAQQIEMQARMGRNERAVTARSTRLPSDADFVSPASAA